MSKVNYQFWVSFCENGDTAKPYGLDKLIST